MSKPEIREMVSYMVHDFELTPGRGHLQRAARRLGADDDDRGAPRDQAGPGGVQSVRNEVSAIPLLCSFDEGHKCRRHHQWRRS